LRAKRSNPQATEQEGNWIASSLALLAMTGGVLEGDIVLIEIKARPTIEHGAT
jgi:urease accessory protein UreH